METQATPENHTAQVGKLFTALKEETGDTPPAETKPAPKAEAPKAAAPKKPAAKSKLKAVDPKAAEPSKPKVLIFGKPGVGKTWAALDFPNVYYIDTEGGANLAHYTDKLKKSGGMYLGPEQGSLDFSEVISQVQALATEDHNFKTLVIDSFTKLYLTYAADAAEEIGDDFGKDKKAANKPTKRLINWLNRIDMNVVLIAHERPEWGMVVNDKTGKKERQEIGATFDAYDKLEYELHLCLHILKNGPQRQARVKKSRLLEFPEGDNFIWSYNDFAKRYGQDVIEGAVQQIVIATPEQVTKIKTLLEIVKLPEGEIEKWFKKASVDCWEEMDSDKIAKCIEALKDRLPK